MLTRESRSGGEMLSRRQVRDRHVPNTTDIRSRTGCARARGRAPEQETRS